ncbi:hypothetical protein [Burkholderia pseudomallei]|uniref:hypothetical protein n=1 Tax=Burkholderia pseudomallei TaxID=28450 RepID=UPI000F26E3CE|nr:hypothetical protein [Burkholderia pseudomallei]VBO96135.1 Uncharacterised protein [Burkholderia pseudomallei]VBP04965.1 Uncharacterised protein [Burkholderia pseudomallei]
MQTDFFLAELPAQTATARLLKLNMNATGESIAIAVVGRFESGKPFARVVTPRILRCLPRDLGRACHTFGTLLVEDYLSSNDVAEGHESNWQPPLRGIEVGPEFVVEADDEESAIVSALGHCALFSPPSSSAEVLVEEGSPRSTDERRFVQAVKTEVLHRNPNLGAGFNRTFSLTHASREFSIDYVGHAYATCYAAINPKGRSRVRLNTAAAGLWRLARARDAFGFAAPERIELTAWVPAPGLPIYRESEYAALNDVVAELREQARRESLSIFTTHDILSASDRLIAEEIAALN